MVIGERVKHKDEGPIRTVRRSRSPRPSNGSSIEVDPSGGDSSGSEDEGGIRIGSEYQATIPDCVTDYKPNTIPDSHARVVWVPEPKPLSARVNEYLEMAQRLYHYSIEQALVLLFWHRHKVDKALADLISFCPRDYDWSLEDKILFEQAFHNNGKNFHKIQQTLSKKTIPSIIQYYYSWKKFRTLVSAGDGKKCGGSEDDNSSNDNNSNDTDSDFESIPSTSSKDSVNGGIKEIQVTPASNLPSGGARMRHSDSRHIGVPGKATSGRFGGSSSGSQRAGKKCPPGYALDSRTLTLMCGHSGEKVRKSLELELISLQAQVQTNKQIVYSQKQRLGDIASFRPPKPNCLLISPNWTQSEIILTVQAVGAYGRDFEAIAEVVGTKTEEQIRGFYGYHSEAYHLDAKVKEFELNKKRKAAAQIEASRVAAGVKDRNGATSLQPEPTVRPPTTSSTLLSHKRNAAGNLIGARPQLAVPSLMLSTNQVSTLNQAPPTAQTSRPPPLFRPTT